MVILYQLRARAAGYQVDTSPGVIDGSRTIWAMVTIASNASTRSFTCAETWYKTN